MKSPFSKNQPGFTLIETLFAIMIFSAALISLMIIASRGIAATAVAQQETVAHYLAQEGLETVRNIRDTNILVPQAWDTGFSQCVSPAVCNVVYSQTSVPSLSVCPQGNCPVYQSPVDNSFVNGPSGALPVPFYSREITVITSGTGSTEYRVKSKVSWVSKTISRTVELQTILKRWR